MRIVAARDSPPLGLCLCDLRSGVRCYIYARVVLVLRGEEKRRVRPRLQMEMTSKLGQRQGGRLRLVRGHHAWTRSLLLQRWTERLERGVTSVTPTALAPKIQKRLHLVRNGTPLLIHT